MNEPDLVGLFARPIDRLGLRYMITGGVASVVYGDPRFTRDLDLVLELDSASVSALLGAFDPDLFYLPPLEAVREEVATVSGGHFNLIHRDSSLNADVYLAKDDPFHLWALDRRRRIELDGGPVWLAPLEYVVVRKLEYFRWSGSDRHLRDIAMMLQVSGSLLDEPTLAAWATRLDVTAELQQAQDFGTHER